jgi:YgiT-type zinc finger domain-containing protein
VTVHRHLKAQHFIFEQVPARVCSHCGERYFSAAVAKRMQREMRKPASKTDVVPVPVISFG